MQTTVKVDLLQSDLTQFLNSLDKVTNQGSRSIIGNDDIDGFFEPGLNPWIGYPTKVEVSSNTEKAHVSCFSSNTSAKLRLEHEKDYYDYNYDTSATIILPKEVISKGNILEARFIFESAKDFIDYNFYCIDEHDHQSPSKGMLISSQQHYSEWSSWSKCYNVGKDLVTRNRTISNKNDPIVQSRCCRCSDLAIYPSPKYVLTTQSWLKRPF